MNIFHRRLIILIFTVLFLTSCGRKTLLEDVVVAPDSITPNADGLEDLTNVSFLLNRNATVAIYFYDEAQHRYTFRAPTPLSLNEKPYTVLFPGVVDGFVQPEESYPFTILKRVLPDGLYTWEVVAETAAGERQAITGTLMVKDADAVLPEMRGYSINPKEYSPK
ncbi:MAG: hypothetical protein RBT47_04625, partial [Anaerolineae bacterium]|nr:hypothetical protein [Anaerolineae bacterium]